MSKRRLDGTKQVLDIFKKSDIFGEMGLIDGLPRSATVTAFEDCVISILSQEVFNNLAYHNPESLMPILKVLARRLRATLALVENLQQNKKDSGVEDALPDKGAG